MPTPDKRGIIRSLKKQEQAYRRVLRSVVDQPILAGFADGLAGAAELAVAIEAGVLSVPKADSSKNSIPQVCHV